MLKRKSAPLDKLENALTYEGIFLLQGKRLSKEVNQVILTLVQGTNKKQQMHE